MSLSCSCDSGRDIDPGDWSYWFHDKDLYFENLNTLRRKRCCSCGELINIGAVCIRFSRYRYPYNAVEAKIKHDDYLFEMNYEPQIKIADHFQCESCGEIYFNLTELGFECLSPSENMPGMLEEYKELYITG